MTELIIAGLNKAFGSRRILRDIDLTIAAGDLVAILGPSGSGKTTLLRLVCGFERADSGTIHIGDKLVSGQGAHVPPEKRHIGYVAQDGALFPHLSVADNIAFGLPPAARRERHGVAELLDLVGLPQSYALRPPQQLSGGEQQRVSLARALAPKPSLVLLDEPFSSLDAGLRAETRQAVAAALAHSGATAILVTHDQAEALSIGDQVAVLLDGRMAQMASPSVLYRRPVDTAVARFVGEAILLRGHARDGFADCPLGRLKLAHGVPEGVVDVLVRPEQIRLVPPHMLQGRPGTIAKIVDVTYYGHDATVRLSLLDGNADTPIVARIAGHDLPQPGQEIGIVVEDALMAYAAV